MKLMTLHVRGKHNDYSFHFYGDPADLADWRADGLTVYQLENTIPEWVPHWAVKTWVWIQDRWNLKCR